MTLYSFFRSSAAYRVRIALNLKGMRYETIGIHLQKDGGLNRKPEYAAINPQMRVPALKLDSGEILIQSLAIIEYLDEIYPEPPLLPKDPADRARVRALADIVACDIHPINNRRVLRYLTHQLGHDEAVIGHWYNHWIGAGFAAIEPLLTRDARTGAFCHGDAPSLADVALVPQVVNAERYKLDLAPYQTLARIYGNCMKLEPFIAAHPRNQPDYEA